jgi:hypothetical protein
MSKFAVISGGTKGIGRAIIEKLAEQGFDIATCARNKSDLESLKSEIENRNGVNVYVKVCDVSNKIELNHFAIFVRNTNPKIDILVNNAGIFKPGSLIEEKDGLLEETLATNTYSAYYLTRYLLDSVKGQKGAYIFNMCSTASFMPYINGGSYCISKFALLGFSKVLREELKDQSVRVSAIMPGPTLTASWEGVDLPEARFIDAKDVAEAVWSAYNMSERTVLEEIVIRPQLGDL